VITNIILIIIGALVIARIIQAHLHQKEIIQWLDALGDMLSDKLGRPK
jgi:hypothetical protein